MNNGMVLVPGGAGGLGDGVVVQGPGDSPNLVMSQKAVTDFVNSRAAGLEASVGVPRFTRRIVYDGTFDGYYEECMEAQGTLRATDAGEYTAAFIPKEGYCWPDGTRSVAEVKWTIQKAPGTCAPSLLSVTMPIGSSQSVTVGRDEDAGITAQSGDPTVVQCAVEGDRVTVTGMARGTAVITIVAAATANHLAATATVEASVLQPVRVPTQLGTPTWSGSALSPAWDGYAAGSESLSIGGTTSAVEAGTYAATFTPRPGFCWDDGTTSAQTVFWEIRKVDGTLTLSDTSVRLASPGATKTVTVACNTGGAISASSSNTSAVSATVENGAVVLTAIGYGKATVTVSAAPVASHTTPQAATLQVMVAQAIDLPTQNGTLTYNGSAQSPTWSGYNSSRMAMGGTISRTDAGTHSASFTPSEGYCWTDVGARRQGRRNGASGRHCAMRA